MTVIDMKLVPLKESDTWMEKDWSRRFQPRDKMSPSFKWEMVLKKRKVDPSCKLEMEVVESMLCKWKDLNFLSHAFLDISSLEIFAVSTYKLSISFLTFPTSIDFPSSPFLPWPKSCLEKQTLSLQQSAFWIVYARKMVLVFWSLSLLQEFESRVARDPKLRFWDLTVLTSDVEDQFDSNHRSEKRFRLRNLKCESAEVLLKFLCSTYSPSWSYFCLGLYFQYFWVPFFRRTLVMISGHQLHW